MERRWGAVWFGVTATNTGDTATGLITTNSMPKAVRLNWNRSSFIKSSMIYFSLRGLNHLPPAISEINTNATAAHEKTVLSVAMPMTRNAIPRMRNMPETLRLFVFILIQYLVYVFEQGIRFAEVALSVQGAGKFFQAVQVAA